MTTTAPPDGICHFSIVGFIDLLGTSECIAHIEAAEDLSEQCQRLGVAVTRVQKFRQNFDETLENLSKVEAS